MPFLQTVATGAIVMGSADLGLTAVVMEIGAAFVLSLAGFSVVVAVFVGVSVVDGVVVGVSTVVTFVEGVSVVEGVVAGVSTVVTFVVGVSVVDGVVVGVSVVLSVVVGATVVVPVS